MSNDKRVEFTECTRCSGSGMVVGWDNEMLDCPHCWEGHIQPCECPMCVGEPVETAADVGNPNNLEDVVDF